MLESFKCSTVANSIVIGHVTFFATIDLGGYSSTRVLNTRVVGCTKCVSDLGSKYNGYSEQKQVSVLVRIPICNLYRVLEYHIVLSALVRLNVVELNCLFPLLT